MQILENYVMRAPSAQNAVDIFGGVWTSSFPHELGVKAGTLPLFEDPRIHWMSNTIGSIKGFRLLELGPLEGAHSYLLDRLGAAEITAVEANQSAFLRCLITKELLGIPSVKYLLGDFNQYLEQTRPRFDLCVASGVLYHMKDPLESLRLMAGASDRLFLWTHYYDKNVLAHSKHFQAGITKQVDWRSRVVTLYQHDYQAELMSSGFCGGGQEYSYWLSKGELIRVLSDLGFEDIRETGDTHTHPKGPAVSILALRKPLRP